MLCFPVEFCCLVVPKNVVGAPFYVSQNYWYRKIFWIRGGGSEGVSRFFVNDFLSHSSEKLPGVTVYSVITFLYRGILCLRGLCHVFLSNVFLSHSSAKTSLMNASVLCVREFRVAKNVMDKRGGGVTRIPLGNFLSRGAQTFRRVSL